MATFPAGGLLHEAGALMDVVTFISRGRLKVYRSGGVVFTPRR